MSTGTAIILSFTVYKLASLVVGLALSAMGYKLFMAGVWGNSGELDAQLGDNKLLLKKAAPGTFFAVAGAIVIGLTIFKGVDYNFVPTSHQQQDEKPVLPSQ